MVIRILITAAKGIKTLSHKITKGVGDAAGIAWIVQNPGDASGKTQSMIDLSKQHDAPIGTDRSPLKIGFNVTTPKASEIDRVKCTIWHRQNKLQYVSSSLYYNAFMRFCRPLS